MANKNVQLTIKHADPFAEHVNVVTSYTDSTETPNFDRGVYAKRLAKDK